MSKSLRRACWCLCALATACSSSRPTVSFDMPVVSSYVARGYVNDQHGVLQPSVSLEQELPEGVLSASVWTNVELSDDRGWENKFVEVDVTLGYALTLGRFDVSFGGVYYAFPNTGFAETSELFCLVSVNELYLTPTLELWYDNDQADGSYINFNLSRDFELGGGWALSTVAGLGWMDADHADYNFGVQVAGLSDLQAMATAAYPISENVSFNTIAVWSSTLDNAYRETPGEADNLILATGLAIGF